MDGYLAPPDNGDVADTALTARPRHIDVRLPLTAELERVVQDLVGAVPDALALYCQAIVVVCDVLHHLIDLSPSCLCQIRMPMHSKLSVTQRLLHDVLSVHQGNFTFTHDLDESLYTALGFSL